MSFENTTNKETTTETLKVICSYKELINSLTSELFTNDTESSKNYDNLKNVPNLNIDKAILLHSLIQSINNEFYFEKISNSLLNDALTLLESKTLKIYKLKESNKICVGENEKIMIMDGIGSSSDEGFEDGCCKCLSGFQLLLNENKPCKMFHCAHLLATYIYLSNNQSLQEFVIEELVSSDSQWAQLCNCIY